MTEAALCFLQDEEVEVNIDDLSQETLWKLYAFISDGATDALPDAPNTSAREKGNATDQVTFLLLLPAICVNPFALQEPMQEGRVLPAACSWQNDHISAWSKL